MRYRLIKIGILFLLIASTALISYFFGFRNGQNQTARNFSSGALMFFTGIHERLSIGDYESAAKISGAAASIQINAFQVLDSYPLILQFWSMFPSKAQSDSMRAHQRFLTQAYDHFSKYPNALMPETMAYLNKFKSAEQDTVANP